MPGSYDFIKSVLDASTHSIVVMNRSGAVVFSNTQWNEFVRQEGFSSSYDWCKANYIEVCDVAAENGDDDAARALEGIRKVSRGEQASYYLEYPCHSQESQRWFMMRVSPFTLVDMQYLVISHQDITRRKTAEEEADRMETLNTLGRLLNNGRI